MGMSEGTVLKWLKQTGEAVEEGDPLAEIEAAKVNTVLESPASGTLAEIVVQEGDTVEIYTTLAVIEAEG